MKIEQIIEAIQADEPKALAGLPEAAASKLLRAAFRTVHKMVTEAPEGSVAVPNLGNFKVKMAQKKDEPDAEPVRRVVFIAAAGEKRNRNETRAARSQDEGHPDKDAKRAERQAARLAAGKTPGRRKKAEDGSGVTDATIVSEAVVKS